MHRDSVILPELKVPGDDGRGQALGRGGPVQPLADAAGELVYLADVLGVGPALAVFGDDGVPRDEGGPGHHLESALFGHAAQLEQRVVEGAVAVYGDYGRGRTLRADQGEPLRKGPGYPPAENGYGDDGEVLRAEVQLLRADRHIQEIRALTYAPGDALRYLFCSARRREIQRRRCFDIHASASFSPILQQPGRHCNSGGNVIESMRRKKDPCRGKMTGGRT